MLRVVPRSPDDLLLVEVGNENPGGVERCLAAGADINGSPHSGEEYPPVVYAAHVGSARMIEFLVSKGADVDGATWREGSFPKHSRALHAAVSSGLDIGSTLDALRALRRAGASAGAKDARGCTALMMACRVMEKGEAARVEMVRELLAAAGPGVVDELDSDGRSALHFAAFSGSTQLIGLLLGRSPPPSTLNQATRDGKTPLLVAVEFGHARVVSLLLSAGASQRGALHLDNYQCPFRGAVDKGDEGIVKLLATEEGMRAVGGAATVVPRAAFSCIVKTRAARMLRLVLSADGEDRRAAWANHRFANLNMTMLHLAVCYGALASVKVLLAAGAVETATGPEGYTTRQVIGNLLPDDGLDPRIRDAIARALERGPAHRARSLAWPAERGGAAPAAAAAAARVGAPLGVKIYRPQNRKVSRSFMRPLDR